MLSSMKRNLNLVSLIWYLILFLIKPWLMKNLIIEMLLYKEVIKVTSNLHWIGREIAKVNKSINSIMMREITRQYRIRKSNPLFRKIQYLSVNKVLNSYNYKIRKMKLDNHNNWTSSISWNLHKMHHHIDPILIKGLK